MAKTYKNNAYFTNRPDVSQIFDDLDKLRDFCRDKSLPFNEADLYNRSSPVWNRYYNYTQKKLRNENQPYQPKSSYQAKQ